MKKGDFDIVSEHAGYIAREEARKVATAEVEKLSTQGRHWQRAALIGAGVALSLLTVGGLAYSQRSLKTPPARERATAKCKDGTYSYAYTLQGACSSHGGIEIKYKGLR